MVEEEGATRALHLPPERLTLADPSAATSATEASNDGVAMDVSEPAEPETRSAFKFTFDQASSSKAQPLAGSKAEGACAVCGAAASSSSRCKRVSYCSTACQRNGWKTHKTECSPSQRRRRLPPLRPSTTQP